MKSSHSAIGKRQILMGEDLSLLDDNTDTRMITLEEKSEETIENPPIICDWQPCDYKSTKKNLLIDHIDEHKEEGKRK